MDIYDKETANELAIANIMAKFHTQKEMNQQMIKTLTSVSATIDALQTQVDANRKYLISHADEIIQLKENIIYLLNKDHSNRLEKEVLSAAFGKN